MEALVAIVAKQKRSIAEARVARLLDGEPFLPFPASSLTHVNGSRSVLVRAWHGADDPFTPQGRWSSRDGRLTTFTGHLWPRSGPWLPGRPWAEQLDERCTPVDVPPRSVSSLASTQPCISIARVGVPSGRIRSDSPCCTPARRTTATSSPLGPTSRPGRWPRAGQPLRRDALGVAWLPYAMNIVGDRTGFEGVRAAGRHLLRGRPAPWSHDPDVVAGAVGADGCGRPRRRAGRGRARGDRGPSARGDERAGLRDRGDAHRWPRHTPDPRGPPLGGAAPAGAVPHLREPRISRTSSSRGSWRTDSVWSTNGVGPAAVP